MKLSQVMWLLVLIMFSFPVLATGKFQSPNQNVDVVNNPIISAVPESNSDATATSNQITNQDQGQNQNANATNAGNSQYTSFHQRRNNPNMGSMFLNPTAVCAGVIHGQGVGGGIGISVGGSYQVVNCEINETAKTWLAAGDLNMFEQVLCQDKHSQGTVRCMELELEQAKRKDELTKQLAALGKIVRANKAIENAAKDRESKTNRKPFDASDW